jgi:hypothetical protein
MTEYIMFAIGRIFTKTCWYFVTCSFIGVILLTFRNTFRAEIFKDAVEWNKTGKKLNW